MQQKSVEEGDYTSNLVGENKTSLNDVNREGRDGGKGRRGGERKDGGNEEAGIGRMYISMRNRAKK